MASVFLSYDRDDRRRASAVAAALVDAGHQVWWDQQISGGSEYSRDIERALAQADVVIVLWSARSIESAWVRDEAADGRDRHKLIPVTIDGTAAPLGFRQFQTIDLSRWPRRSKAPLALLLTAVETFGADAQPPLAPAAAPKARLERRAVVACAMIAVLLLVLGAGVAWFRSGTGRLPIVEVAAANDLPGSKAAAADLFVKLGALSQIGKGRWQLVEADSKASDADLLFRTEDASVAGHPKANLTLVNGDDRALLWSRELSVEGGSEADLRQRISSVAGRVLGCTLESRAAGDLGADLLKLFLNVCSSIDEASDPDPSTLIGMLRTIVAAKPDFAPAWSRLVLLDIDRIDVSDDTAEERAQARRDLQTDIAEARQHTRNLAAFTLAETALLPPSAFGKRLELLRDAISHAPDDSNLANAQSVALQRVGRLADSVDAARRAAELDPLSPGLMTQHVMAIAYAGHLDEAKNQLAAAEKLWAGTGALRNAQWAYALRYGAPASALALNPSENDAGTTAYLAARATRSPGAIANLTAFIAQFKQKTVSTGQFVWGIQALGEFNLNDEVLYWIGRMPNEDLAANSYLLFRPGLAGLRKDPRFMAIAKRIGLVEYWRGSGDWPDFCARPGIDYDCKAEADRLSQT